MSAWRGEGGGWTTGSSTAWSHLGSVFNLNVVVPPNTTAQIFVPTTNANAITESGLPAASSPGVTFLGLSNSCAVYAVGSGSYSWVSPLAAGPVTPLTIETDSVYSNGSFPPLTAGDLLTNTSTTIATNTLTFANENYLGVAALRDGNVGAPGTTNRSVEISGGGVIFRLGPGSAGLGYTVTNLSAYTAWRDDGRENANYSVSASPDGTNFTLIASVAYNPSPYPTKDGTGGTLTSIAATGLTGVQYLKWDFSAAQQNGGVGYSELAACGQPTTPPIAPAWSAVIPLSASSFVLGLKGLAIGRNYAVESSTNLSLGAWIIETNFLATQAVGSITNSSPNAAQKFYRVLAY